jgi:hypothetical protein
VRATSRARAVRGNPVRARRLLVGYAQAAFRARAVRGSLARARRHLVGHAQAASVAVGRGARLSFLLRTLFGAGRRAALQRPCLVVLSLFLNRARRGDTLAFRRAATPCRAEARRVHRVAITISNINHSTRLRED